MTPQQLCQKVGSGPWTSRIAVAAGLALVALAIFAGPAPAAPAAATPAAPPGPAVSTAAPPPGSDAPTPAVLAPETLARLVAVRDPRISPDGGLVAFTASDSLDPTLVQIWLADVDGRRPPRPFTAGGRSAHSPRWSPKGDQLLFLSASGDTAAEQIRIINLAGGGSRLVTEEPRGVTDMSWSPDGSLVAYLAPGAPPPPGDPVNAAMPKPGVRLRIREMASGRTWTASPDSVSVWDARWSPDGRRLAVLFTRPGSIGEWRRGMLAVVRTDGSRWSRIAGRVDPTQNTAWSPDGKLLAFYALPAARYAYPALHIVRAGGRDIWRIVPPDFQGTDEGILWTAATGLVVNGFEGVRCFLTRIDPATGARTRLPERWVSPGDAGRSVSASTTGTLAWLSDGIDHPAEVFALNAGGGAPRRLTHSNHQLEHVEFAPPQPVTWTSFDGRRIEGLLFLPPQTFPRPVPLIVQPHGGPSWHWTLGFFADAHNPALFLAPRGYALFYPNPRGSTGYGEAFNSLNRGDLGGGDYRDIQAGIDSLVAAGVADGRRLAIDGYSYGGFMTAWAISQSDRFRCAVAGGGPTDFFTDYTQNELTPWWHREYLGADPWDDPAAYRAHSPLFRVRDIRTPILIVHGAEDTRVSPAQSRELHAALTRLGAPAELRIYPREGHGFTEMGHQVDFMRRQLAWFERWLGRPSTPRR